jgi:hypothetical protein
MKDVTVILRIPSGTSVVYQWREFETWFGELESLAYQMNREAVFSFCAQYKVSSLYRDAALERLRRFRNQRVLVRDVRSGSWEFVLGMAAGAGLVLWQTLVKDTVAKDMVDGYKTSRFSAEFKEFAGLATDALLLKWLDKLRSSKVFHRAKIVRRDREIMVELRDAPKETNRLPTTEELLDRLDGPGT